MNCAAMATAPCHAATASDPPNGCWPLLALMPVSVAVLGFCTCWA